MSNATKFKIIDEETLNSGKFIEEEGVTHITVQYPEIGTRFTNNVIDRICFFILLFLIEFQYHNLKGYDSPTYFNNTSSGDGLTPYFFAAVLTVVYYSFFEYFTQRTPGKYFTKTIVIDDYGNKPEFSSILTRSFSRLVPFDALSFLSNNDRGWHDRWSNTHVITIKELENIHSLMSIEEIGNPETFDFEGKEEL